VWWEPDDFSVDLRGQVDALLRSYREHRDHAGVGAEDLLVWGVGSAPDERGQWTRPLVLVSYEAFVAAEGRELPLERFGYDELFAVAGQSQLTSMLEVWSVPRNAVFDVTTRPLPASGDVQPGDLVQEAVPGSRQATVGLPCLITASSEPAFLTAGHLVNGVGDQVEIAATGSGVQTWVTGEVVHWSDPAHIGSADYDYAVVKLTDAGDRILSAVHNGPAGPPTPPHQTIDVAIHSAQSGSQYGQISGALAELGDTPRSWLNCWQVAPSRLLTLGDSGSMVIGDSGPNKDKILGHFVGGSYWARGAPGLIHLYVQDLGSCLAAGLGKLITL
jgi:hypothetical protein